MDDIPAGATLAQRLTWLLHAANPAGQGPVSALAAQAMVSEATSEHISHSTIWKIANGTITNPSLRTLDALARTFGVPISFLAGETSDEETARLREQAELISLIRAAGIDLAEMRAIAGVTPAVRRAMLDLIRQTARAETRQPQAESPDSSQPGERPVLRQ